MTKILASDPKVDKSWISNIGFTNDDAKEIANALKPNTHLEKLNLQGNNFFIALAEKVFHKMIYDDSSLVVILKMPKSR